MDGAQEGGPHLVHEAHDDGGGRQVVMDPLLRAPATAALLLCPAEHRRETCREGNWETWNKGAWLPMGLGRESRGQPCGDRMHPPFLSSRDLSFPPHPQVTSPPHEQWEGAGERGRSQLCTLLLGTPAGKGALCTGCPPVML